MENGKVVEAALLLNATVYEDEASENIIPLIQKKIKTVEVKDAELIEIFLKTCESIPDDLEKYIPDSVSDVYNALVEEEEKLEAEKKAPIAEKKPVKIAKPEKVKEKVAVKRLSTPSVNKTIFGHRIGKGSGTIDTMLLEGKPLTLKEIAEKLSTTELRVYMHVCELPSKGANVIVETDAAGIKSYFIDPKNPMAEK